MRTYKNIVLALLLLACSNANAYDFEVDGIYYNIISSTEKTAEVTFQSDQGNDYYENVVIPKQVLYNNDIYSVTSIGDSAFYACYRLTSVTIPGSVTTIDNSAFKLCRGLTSVTIPNSVTSIGDGAFYNCSKLTSVTIPNSVTSIGNFAFSDCSKLTSVTIPNSVTSIGNGAFDSCFNIKELVIKDGKKILHLGYNYNASFPEFVEGLFYDCPLETVYLGRNLSYNNSYNNYSPFYGTSITSLTISDSVTTIGDGAFSDCSKLTSVTIPDGVTSIGICAFNGCI